jgi:hypothetical protein
VRETLEAGQLEALAAAADARARRCGRPHEARVARATAEALRLRAAALRASAAARARPALEVVPPAQPGADPANGSA